mmetsp:Transcript_20347/g.42699  ORF Transcript_20347/g.42699 Transcript_20347/m.42699 type:complete len:867 (+) Transcript_20347:67-2667(+)
MSSTKERVTHILDPTAASHIPLFLPRITVTRGGGGGDDDEGQNSEDVRPFKNDTDIDRVMDYPNMPDPPPDCIVMHCEAPGSGVGAGNDDDEEYDGGFVFPKRNAKLSGGYIFLTRPKDNKTDKDGGAAGAGKAAGGKVVCIPIQGCKVEFPPGGRRVFREHAHTGARKGYEMAMRIQPSSSSGDQPMTCYIVLDSLKLRENWAAAIRLRHDVGKKFTILRPGGLAAARLMSADDEQQQQQSLMAGGMMGGSSMMPTRPNQGKQKQKHWGIARKAGTADEPASSGNADLDAAIGQFGVHGFNEEKWVHEFLRKHAVNELPEECDRLEKWMDVIKNGLRGAVLEQYEYFVEASREMSTMGREVAWIRTLVERQQETLMSMRNIDFGAGFEDVEDGAGPEGYGYLSEDDVLDGDNASDASSVVSSSSEEDSNPSANRTPMRANVRNRRRDSRIKKTAPMTPVDENEGSAPSGTGQSSHIEIPAWISDVTEEVSAFIKESRYSDATELILKAKTEVSDILAAHEQPTPPVVTTPKSSLNNRNMGSNATPFNGSTNSNTQKKLHKKQQSLLQRTNVQLDALMDRMSKRLAENLRRKNEALKASAKRERADPLSNLAPLVSPVCLNDDAVALHLLVKLGRYQEAATAYAARRSLLLSECLHERPISSPVGMDAVIYAAQISSSFFSSLAIAVEGFLDLFIDSNSENSGNDDDTSLNSRSLTLGSGEKRIPPGALSAIVLWCDSELAKFTNVFGSSRLLGSLALSPPGIRRQENKDGGKISLAKEREHSIEVAAKCVSQAFAFASENLDSIGLPLTPKLAENMRPKLKGCEAEVAALLDMRWKALSFEWTMERNVSSRLSMTPRSSTDDRRV